MSCVWRSTNNSPYRLLLHTESGLSYPEIYNLNLSCLTLISHSVFPPPLTYLPPDSPHSSSLSWRMDLGGLGKVWIRSPLLCMSRLCAPWTSLEKSGSVRFTFLTWPEFHYRSTSYHPKSPQPEIKACCIKRNLWVGLIRNATRSPYIFLHKKECFSGNQQIL